MLQEAFIFFTLDVRTTLEAEVSRPSECACCAAHASLHLIAVDVLINTIVCTES